MSENVPFMLAQTDKAVQVHVDKEVAEFGLTRSQWLLLSMLYFVNGCNQKDLSDLMDIGKGALGKLAKKLEQKGWIDRIIDSQDTRAIRLHISDEAMPIVKKLIDLLFEITRKIETDVSDEEIATLKQILNKIRLNVEVSPSTVRWKRLKSQLIEEVRLLEKRHS